jgi:CPA1 family monovalent cation:H+ antiporter
MHTFEILLALLAACIALAAVAQRLQVPLAVALVLGGMALALIPGLPVVELEPELALALFLPPLLQVSAYRTDWPAFKSNLRPILLLAVGAVFFTALCVAAVTKLLVPDLPWWAAIALGAIVAPPDAVAASAVLKQVKLPRRIDPRPCIGSHGDKLFLPVVLLFDLGKDMITAAEYSGRHMFGPPQENFNARSLCQRTAVCHRRRRFALPADRARHQAEGQ